MRFVVVAGLVTACHGGHPATVDGGGDGSVTDAAHDGVVDTIDAPRRGPITVTVYGDGQDRNPGVLVPGASVYFVEPDQTVTNITTGTDGVATAQEPDNTTVWIVHHDSTSSYYIETYEGLLIGDSIIGGDPKPLGANTVVGNAYVAFPSFSDATSYKLAVSCVGGYTPSSSSPIAPSFVACPQEMSANAIVWATDSTGNLGYTMATGVDLTAHTSASTALTLPAFQAGSTIGVTFTNLPSSMGESDADIYVRHTSGTDPTILQNVELRESTLTGTMTASDVIAPVGDQTRVQGIVNIGAYEYGYNYDVTVPGVQSSVTIDASTMVHPVIAHTWQYDSASRSITWTQHAFGVDPTVVQSGMSWNLGPSVAWRLIAPYEGAPSLTLPPFPPALAGLMLSPSDAVYKQVDLTSYAGKTYHDVVVGQAAGAASWRIGVGS
jgi:hypothetical protein